jgi:plasmid stabilization system protein ParE
MRVRYRERALRDLEDIFQYLNDRSPAGAHNVIEAIYAAVNSVADHPLSTQQTSDPAIRVKIVGRYGYKIFYSATADTIEILHVRHGTRRPWSPEGGGR